MSLAPRTTRRTRNPFSPGFGKIPYMLVGRDDLLDDMAEGLDEGPLDERYTTLLLGVRGSGKTVLLREIENTAEEMGCIVLSVDAHTPGLKARIAEAIDRAARRYEGMRADPPAGHERTITLKLGIVEFASKMALGPEPPPLYDQLEALALKAQESETGILLTIDEAHAVDRREAREIFGYLQRITGNLNLPLAFAGAGLSEMEYTLLQDNKSTFLQRCHRLRMPPLTESDAIQGLRLTIEGAGGSIGHGPLTTAAAQVGSSPYKLQIIGAEAWKIAGAPDNPIDEFAVEHAVRIAEERMDQNVGAAAWRDLGDPDKAYLAAVHRLGDTATHHSVAADLGVARSRVAGMADRLALSGYIAIGDQGGIAPTDLVSARIATEAAPIWEGRTGTGRVPPAKARQCRKWMPRAKAHCVSPAGHKDGCRSR